MYEGTYNVQITIPGTIPPEPIAGKLVINTQPEGLSEKLQPGSYLSFSGNEFELSGTIQKAGVATISGQTEDAEWQFKNTLWSFVNVPAQQVVSAGWVVVQGPHGTSFGFSMFGSREGQKDIMSQEIPEPFLASSQSLSSRTPK